MTGVFKPVGLSKMGSLLLSYAELLKLRIVGMVLATCSMGVLLAGGLAAWRCSFCVLLGTGLLAAGACALNQYLERARDSLMDRTKSRPLPSGKVSTRQVVVFGGMLILTGASVLLACTNGLTTALGLLSVGIYLGIYVPAKRMSWVCTPIGAVAGAIPPLMGWVSVSGRIGAGGWLLFFILFLWQHVHFYAIAWIYREDYRRGGFPMLPVVDSDGEHTVSQMISAAVALLVLPGFGALLGLAGPLFAWGSLATGGALLAAVFGFWGLRSRESARWVLLASIFYLPCLFGLITADLL